MPEHTPVEHFGVYYEGIGGKHPEVIDIEPQDENISFGLSVEEFKVAMLKQRIEHLQEVEDIKADKEQCPRLNEINNYYRRLGNKAI